MKAHEQAFVKQMREQLDAQRRSTREEIERELADAQFIENINHRSDMKRLSAQHAAQAAYRRRANAIKAAKARRARTQQRAASCAFVFALLMFVMYCANNGLTRYLVSALLLGLLVYATYALAVFIRDENRNEEANRRIKE
jgi:ABC-type transport system involved in cytochrome bd biosynthesis fused ATPase/permease subunit